MISRDKRVTDQEVEEFKRLLLKCKQDTVVRCFECNSETMLRFADGIRGGWPKCCGYTMTIVYMDTDIDKAVGGICKEAVANATVVMSCNKTNTKEEKI